MIDLEKFKVKLPMLDISRPIIVHAPSSRFKGTEFVIDAIKSLESEGYDLSLCLLKILQIVKRFKYMGKPT